MLIRKLVCECLNFHWLLAALIIFSLLTGCATEPVPEKQQHRINPSDEIPVIALDVYRHGTDFFFTLRQDKQSLYAGAYLPEAKAVNTQRQSRQFSAPSLAPIDYYQSTPWTALPKAASKIVVLGVDQWYQLREELFKSVIPRDKTGLVMNFEYEDYFLFYDDEEKFQATRLVDKPGDYQVKDYLHFEKFVSDAAPILKDFLLQQGISADEFILNTGDVGLYSLPFLYINTQERQLAFFRNVPLQPVALSNFPGVKSGQTLVHVLRSHVGGVYTRPVSSLFRLVTAISDTAVTTASFEWATALSEQPVPPLSNAAPMNLQQWESDLDQLTTHDQSSGSIDFLVDGEAFFTRFIDTVSAAKKTVHLQTYIFDNDDYAIQIADLLKNRSKQGVQVKVLLDGLGTITAGMADSPSLPESHVAPVSISQYLENNSKVNVRQKENPWLTSDHVKSIIIDREIAFVGGMNIGREYRYDWHDLMLELQGPVVDLIEKEFLKAWSHAGPLGDFGYIISKSWRLAESRTVNNSARLRMLLTKPGNYEIYSTQLEAIRRAKRYIYIQNAYITNDRVLRELVKARRRGVDVRVITPIETDHQTITKSNVLAVNVMLENGIRVYIYPGFSHVKAAIYDGWVCVGSANFDRLSLRINRELNIASSDPEIAQQLLEKLFQSDFENSPELTEPLPERWVDRLAEIIGDYLY